MDESLDTDRPPAPNEAKIHPFTFQGKTSEYFRIWIVNVVLTILSLGIYLAWAKVRKRRYLYANTFLDGHPFEYTAKALPIFKSHLIIGTWAIIYNFLSAFAIIASMVFFCVGLIFLPWLVSKSLRFKAFHCKFRNLRHSSRATTKEARSIYLWLPLLNLFCLGLLTPLILYRQRKLLWNNLDYGETPFSTAFGSKPFYLHFFCALIPSFITAATAMFFAFKMFFSEEASDPSVLLITFAVYPIFLICFLLGKSYYDTKINNHAFPLTQLGEEAHLQCNLQLGKMIWITVTNVIAVVLTLGLAYPWALMRSTRYRFSRMALKSEKNLGSYTGAPESGEGALGDVASDYFDIDIG